MSIIGLFVVLRVIGVLLWAVTTYIPMADPIRKLIIIVGVLLAVLYVLSAFGVLGSLNTGIPQFGRSRWSR